MCVYGRGSQEGVYLLCRSCLEVRGVSNWICKVKDFDLASGGWQLMSGVQLWEGTREVSQPLFRECGSLSMCISDSMLWLRMTANYLTIQWTLRYMCHDASRHNWFTIKTVLSRRKTLTHFASLLSSTPISKLVII